jgi:hypothetical protein
MTYYYTYRITCIHPNSKEKYYYGFRKSSKHPLQDNYWSSSKYVKESMAKYGLNYFKKKVIKIFDVAENAIEHESLLHERLNVDKNPLFFNKCKSTIWGFRSTGLILSGRSYEEIHGPERAKELKKQRSDDMKKWRADHPVSGSNNPNYANKWSEEKKAEFASKRQGADHPAHGSMWINNGIESKKILKSDTIPEGWVKGRLRTWKNQYGK